LKGSVAGAAAAEEVRAARRRCTWCAHSLAASGAAGDVLPAGAGCALVGPSIGKRTAADAVKT